MTRPLERMFVLALALAAAGCASAGARPVDEIASRDVQLTVENQRFADAVVYAVWGAGPRDRLGMVTGNTTRTFATPVRRGGDMRVEVHFVGGDDLAAESIGVFEGEDIHLVIQPGM